MHLCVYDSDGELYVSKFRKKIAMDGGDEVNEFVFVDVNITT